MPVNQPPISENDIVRSSWDLEVTNLVNQLEQRLVQLEQTPTVLNVPSPVTPGTGGLLRQNNYIQTYRSNNQVYTFVLTAEDAEIANGAIPETHLLYLNGMKLLESAATERDYMVENNVITLQPNVGTMVNAIDGSILELIVLRT